MILKYVADPYSLLLQLITQCLDSICSDNSNCTPVSWTIRLHSPVDYIPSRLECKFAYFKEGKGSAASNYKQRSVENYPSYLELLQTDLPKKSDFLRVSSFKNSPVSHLLHKQGKLALGAWGTQLANGSMLVMIYS